MASAKTRPAKKPKPAKDSKSPFAKVESATAKTALQKGESAPSAKTKKVESATAKTVPKKVKSATAKTALKKGESATSAKTASKKVESAPTAKTALESAPSAETALESASSAKTALESAPSAKTALESAPSAKTALESATSAKTALESATSAKTASKKVESASVKTNLRNVESYAAKPRDTANKVEPPTYEVMSYEWSLYEDSSEDRDDEHDWDPEDAWNRSWSSDSEYYEEYKNVKPKAELNSRHAVAKTDTLSRGEMNKVAIVEDVVSTTQLDPQAKKIKLLDGSAGSAVHAQSPLLSTLQSVSNPMDSVSLVKKQAETDKERLTSSSMVVYVELPQFGSPTLTFYRSDLGEIVHLKNNFGAPYVKGALYYCKFESDGTILSQCRVEFPDDYAIPKLHPRFRDPPRFPSSPLLNGVCFTAYIIHVDEQISVKTTRGRNTNTREVYVLMQGRQDDSVKYPVTIWGEHCKKKFRIGDVMMVLNAKQALFQQRLRFNIGDTGTITFLTKAPCAAEFMKWAKKTLKDEGSDLSLQLPPGIKLWKAN